MYQIKHIKLYVEANDPDGLKAYLKSEYYRNTLKLEDILPIIDDVNSFEIALCLLEYAIKLNKLTYSELVKQINRADLEEAPKHQLEVNLFAYAVLNQEFTVAESFLQKLDRQEIGHYEKQQWNLHLLNQVNSDGVPLLQQCFLDNPKNDVTLQFLIEHGCNINQTDSQNRTLGDLASVQHQQHKKLLEYIVQKGGDWRPYPGYLFEQINRRADTAAISMALSISGHLLHEHNGQTIFEAVIAKRDFATLRLLLAHVQELVIAKAQVAERNTRLPVEQLRECSFILEHCLNIYKNSNEEIKNIFREYNLHLIDAAPFDIYKQQLPLSQEQLLFSQGLLNFLSEYQGRTLRPFYVQSLKSTAHQAARFLSLQDRMQYIANHLMEDFHKKAILSHDNGAYLQHRTEQKEQARINETKRNDVTIQQHLQKYFEEKRVQLRQQEQQLAQAHENQQKAALANTMLESNLEDIPVQINEILEFLTTIMNERDLEKIKHQRVDWIFSSTTFITAIAFFIRAALHRDEPSDEYSNLDCGAIALAVHWAIRFTLGAFDLEENHLRLNDLAPRLREQVKDLFIILDGFNLETSIGTDNPKVSDLIRSLWQAHTRCKNQLELIQEIITQRQVNIPEALTEPALINYNWGPGYWDNNDSTSFFCTYLCFVGIEGAVSLIGCYFHNDIKNDLEDSSEEYGLDHSDLHTPHTVCFKLGGFVAIQLGLFPAYWLGNGFYCLGQKTGPCVIARTTQAWQQFIRPALNNHSELRQRLLGEEDNRPLVEFASPV